MMEAVQFSLRYVDFSGCTKNSELINYACRFSNIFKFYAQALVLDRACIIRYPEQKRPTQYFNQISMRDPAFISAIQDHVIANAADILKNADKKGAGTAIRQLYGVYGGLEMIERGAILDSGARQDAEQDVRPVKVTMSYRGGNMVFGNGALRMQSGLAQ